MFELRGKYATAKIFTDVVDQASISQVMNLLNQPYAAGSRIRMMPDIHAGAGCTIGTTMTITDKVCPNLVGADIGCGMETVLLKEKHIELQKLDVVIRDGIPSGYTIRQTEHRFTEQINLSELFCAKHINFDRCYKSLGTLGGGNHFIEVDRDEEGLLYLVIHSGSRHLGTEVATFYQNAAYEALQGCKDTEAAKVPFVLAYAEGELLAQYLHDMQIAQTFAMLNRKAIVDTIVKGMGLHVIDTFTTTHNYIDVDHKILRKGAVSARKDERLLIPINMRDGSLLCTGKGNDDWNQSAPHGAGRLMSRSEAKESFTVSEFKKQMKGIYTTSVSQSTLDESPMAYKAMADIVDNIDPTVNIDTIIKPIYNFKAGESD